MRIKKITQNTRDFNITDAVTDGGTDLNEVTFNQMQDNIEEGINEVNDTLAEVGNSQLLVSFNTKEIETKNIEDYTQYRFLYFAIYGYGQCLGSAIVPVEAFTAMGLATSSGGGFKVKDGDYGANIYRVDGTTTQLAGKVGSTSYPVYVYGIK